MVYLRKLFIYQNPQSLVVIYEEKIPIDQEVKNTAEEFKFNSTTAALNGVKIMNSYLQ